MVLPLLTAVVVAAAQGMLAVDNRELVVPVEVEVGGIQQ
jgi:hypothetical protein